MRVTVRKESSERGLARVCQSPRGFVISVDGKRVGMVGWASDGLGRHGTGYWYWWARIGETLRNTANEKVRIATKEEARDACVAWVKAASTPSEGTANGGSDA